MGWYATPMEINSRISESFFVCGPSDLTMRSVAILMTILLISPVLGGCLGTDAIPSIFDDSPEEEPLRINHIQMEGTHNSYHVEPIFSPTREYMYTHEDLDIQATDQGVRQFEIDVWWDVREGLRVYHNQYDSGTTCPTFQSCLEILLAWSLENSLHHPIMIWVEPKDWPEQAAEITTTVELTGILQEIESEISEFWPLNLSITPDEVRGERSNLTDAILNDGWPLLEESRGKAMFVLLATGGMRDLYMEEYPGLTGARMFPMFTTQGQYPGEEAVFSLTDPIGDGEEITRLVEDGFIVRTRADSGGTEPDNNDTSRFEAALSSGAHTIATDYPAPVDGMDYWIEIPEGSPSRCNPIVSPDWCTSLAIENLEISD